ncbi:hypothetical protein KBZ10_15950 [Streptomyces sp. F63]|uniref:hypothetical protein n=1 Tax=Streptomyces sp. F63 TaxID=2824887 RepID=UPI001B368490|nr:hypothetical protein [Streptomyces sp. F63]MBQ0985985.1 hypothetical protein [Streptomyces sp. F63]
MAWDEWEHLKADAAARRQQDRMELNGTGSGGGSRPDLKTNDSGKKAAVKALREDVRPGADKAGSHAEESSGAAVREFSGWDTGSGLKEAHEEWELQVKALKGRLAADETALENTKRDFQHLDLGTRSRIAQIDTGLDPRRES